MKQKLLFDISEGMGSLQWNNDKLLFNIQKKYFVIVRCTDIHL